MSNSQEPIKPGVDNRYWFEFSKKMIESATSSRNEAAEKLQKMIVWLWGIYTASATVGIALSKTSYSFPIILLIASPSTLLIAAYWLAVWTQMPVRAQFDPRIPKDIERAYLKTVKIKSRKLAFTLSLSLIAAFLVSLALIAASLNKQTALSNFQAHYHASKKSNIIAIKGHFPPETKIVLQITPFSRPINKFIPKELLYVTSTSGELQANIELDFTADKYKVTTKWEEIDGLVRSLARVVIPVKPGVPKANGKKR